MCEGNPVCKTRPLLMSVCQFYKNKQPERQCVGETNGGRGEELTQNKVHKADEVQNDHDNDNNQKEDMNNKMTKDGELFLQKF